MEQYIAIFGYFFSIGLTGYFIYRVSRLYIGEDKIYNYILEYYQQKGITVNDISELELTERLKYGVPIISIFRIYNYMFGIFTGKIDYTRKVNVSDKKNKEYIKYIELIYHGKKRIEIKEFESYEI